MLETIAVVLSLVALIVTVFGFFASLKFYLDGVKMQSRSEAALAKIEERSSSTQSLIGGMFNKAFDAAISRTSPQEAQKQQSSMLKDDSTPVRDPVGTSPGEGLAAVSDYDQKVLEFYAFRGLRFTDINNSDWRVIFNLGSDARFNLLNGEVSIVFLGNFVKLEPEQIVARTRILFNNLAIAYAAIRSDVTEPVVRKHAEDLLDRISIEILAGNNVDKNILAAKIAEYQLEAKTIEVLVRTPAEITALVDEEYRRMSIGPPIA